MQDNVLKGSSLTPFSSHTMAWVLTTQPVPKSVVKQELSLVVHLSLSPLGTGQRLYLPCWAHNAK